MNSKPEKESSLSRAEADGAQESVPLSLNQTPPDAKTSSSAAASIWKALVGAKSFWTTLGIGSASAIGTLCLALGDLIRNEHAATVVKLTEAFARFVAPGLGRGWIALMFLVLLGAVVGVIHKPRTSVDAFARGFSVLALFSVAAPFNRPPVGLDQETTLAPSTSLSLPATETPPEQPSEPAAESLGSVRWSLSLASPAFAAEIAQEGGRPTAGQSPAKPELGSALIHLRPEKGTASIQSALVTIRDSESLTVLGAEEIPSREFSVVRASGTYLVEVEAPGYRTTRTVLDIEAGVERLYSLVLPPSAIPVSLQRLVAPVDKTLIGPPVIISVAATESTPMRPIDLTAAADGLHVLDSTGGLFWVSKVTGERRTLVRGRSPFRPAGLAAGSINGRQLVFVTANMDRPGVSWGRLLSWSSEGLEQQVEQPNARFGGVAVDEASGTLYLARTATRELYSSPVGGKGEIELRYELSVRAAASLGALAVIPNQRRVFAADPVGGEVFDLDLRTGTASRILRNLREPSSLVYDPTRQRLYIVEATAKRITVREPAPEEASGHRLRRFSSYEGFEEPRGIALDDAGNVWIADRFDQALLQFSPSGQLLRVLK